MTDLAPIKEKLNSKWWRLNNLYYITNEKGEKVKFKPNLAQKQLLKDLHYRNIILKARQLGFTTLIQILFLDAALFNKNVRCGVIAHNLKDVATFFRDKIKFAYDNIPEAYKPLLPKAIKNESGELLLDNNSGVRVGTSMRSGTLQYLHVSEYGKLCAKFPEKAKEVRTGAFPAVHEGSFLFIESTAEGQEGHFYDLCKTAMDADLLDANRELGMMENKFHFFPWWRDPRYQSDTKVVLPQEYIKYFSRLKLKYGIELSAKQMSWYYQRALEQGEDMKREYPSYPQEAFEAAIEGAYFSTAMAHLRKAGRLCEVPWDPYFPVNTFWDLGLNDSMCIWFHQNIRGQDRLFDYYENEGEGLDHYANVLKDKGYMYGTHYMPHDINVRELGNNGKTRKKAAEDLGISPIITVERARNLDEVLNGIESTRRLLRTCYIDEVSCSQGVKWLDLYRREWDEKLGVWKKQPRHDAASHCADALRTGAVGYVKEIQRSRGDLEPEATEVY